MMWLIYLVGTIDSISNAIIGIGFLFLVLALIKIIIITATTSWEKDTYSFRDLSEEEKNKRLGEIAISTKKLIRVGIAFPILATIFFVIGNLLPSSATISAMYLIPKITSNQQLQQIPDKALTLLNDKLDEWIKDAQKGGDK